MKKILVIISVIVLSLVAWMYSYAATWFQNAPTLVTSSSTAIEITWDKIDWATWYYVYYSTTSWKDYKSTWNIIADNKATINNLDAWKTYYVTVSYVDSDWKESWVSPEWTFTTQSDSTKFALNSVTAINFNELELTFTKDLDFSSWATRDFKITTDDDTSVAEVKEIMLNKLDNTKLNLVLDKNLTAWEYKLTVIYITDSNWDSIEEWINSEMKFIIPESFTTNTTNTLNYVVLGDCDWWVCNSIIDSTWSTNDNSNYWIVADTWITDNDVNTWSIDDNIELNSASDTWITTDDQTQVNTWIFWTDMTWIVENQDSVAMESTKLPKTWPESIILIFISLLVWFIIMKKNYIKIILL